MDEMMTGLDLKISEVAARIKELRHICGMSKETMAKLTGVSKEEYVACEEGKHDLSFAFIYRCALAFKVGVTKDSSIRFGVERCPRIKSPKRCTITPPPSILLKRAIDSP